MAYMILEQVTGDTCGDGRIGLPFRWRVKESTFEKPLPDMEVVGLKFAELIPITQDDIDNFPAEFRIDRIGSCNQCGYCCGYIAKNTFTENACVHLKRTGGDKGTCLIYANLADVCTDPDCNDQDQDGTHSTCIPPPHQPYPVDICSYKFIVTTPGLAISNKEISRMFWAKDKNLIGKRIR